MNYVTSVLERTRFQTAERVPMFAPFARFKAVRRFGSLDGWRAMAIIAVIWHHTMSASFTSPIAAEGRHGVTLFFAISGFLIVTLLLRAQESPDGFSLWKFWGRRALRILPIYYTVLIAYVVLVRFTDHSDAGVEFFQNLPFFSTFTANWFVNAQERTIFFFSWSLAAEEQFYLLWPLAEVLIPRRSHKLILLVGLIVATQVGLYIRGFESNGDLPLRILSSVPLGIMLGTGLAHLMNHETTFRVLYAVLGRRGSAFGCLVFAACIMGVAPYIGFAGELLVVAALALLVAVTVIREDNDLAGMLRWRPIAWIGAVSYGMYMLHMLAVNIVRKGSAVLSVHSPGLVFIGATCVACAMASLSYLYYERPFLLLKDRFFRN